MMTYVLFGLPKNLVIAILFAVGVTSFSGLTAVVTLRILNRRREAKRKINPFISPPPLPKATPRAAPVAMRLDYNRLFDFLKNLSDEEVQTIIRGEIPLKTAMILRFIPFDRRLRILQSMAPKERIEIESLASEVERIPSDEFIRTADCVRKKLSRSPDTHSVTDEEPFWEKAIQKSTAKDAILEALRRTRPDLRYLVERLSIRIDDVPSLPQAKLEQALSKLSDHELAPALAACPRHVVEHLIRALTPHRRNRILAKLRTQGNLSKSVSEPALKALMRRFQEAGT